MAETTGGALVVPPKAGTSLTEASQYALMIDGDLSKLNPAQRLDYYTWVCKELGLEPLSRPFLVLVTKDKKMILYASKACTDQLRKMYRASVTLRDRQFDDQRGLYSCVAHIQTPDGRMDESVGSVPLKTWRKNADEKWELKELEGEDLSNAVMKAETKAKRRATLSLFGLGILDESEIESIRGARQIPVQEFLEGPKKVTPAQETALITLASEKGVLLHTINDRYGIHNPSELTVEQWEQEMKRLELRYIQAQPDGGTDGVAK